MLLLLAASACQAPQVVATPLATLARGQSPAKMLPQEITAVPPAPPVRALPPTPTPYPTVAPTPLPSLLRATPRAQLPAENATAVLVEATAVPAGPCGERLPTHDLLAIVTLEYGLSRDYEPPDLVALGDYFPFAVTLGYPTEIREVMVAPLTRMIEEMIAAGLSPQIVSGYRSYAAQAIAWKKWNELYPEHAAIISAPPGHSEHQLGTVIDFGSPELPGIVGDPEIQFHTYFYKTSEGEWLSAHAHEYGFTLSYTPEAFETTGFYYEPWHYRYVGEEMAARLRDQAITLTEFQLANQPAPCIP